MSQSNHLNSAIIDIDHLCTQFGNHVIHDQLCLQVRKGEILGIVGGSGSGKSVLLNMMIRLLRPKSGTVSMFGQDINHMDEASWNNIQKRFGVLFQEGALFSSLTVQDNLLFPLKESSFHIHAAMMSQLAQLKLELAGLGASSLQKYPSELSGGMKKRVALARALMLDPEILFLDEPTAGLDPISANAFDQLIKEWHNNLGITVVLVTHDLDTLVEICDRIAVIIDKKVIVGSLDELLKQPHPWIQEYFNGPRGRNAIAYHDQHLKREHHGKSSQ